MQWTTTNGKRYFKCIKWNQEQCEVFRKCPDWNDKC